MGWHVTTMRETADSHGVRCLMTERPINVTDLSWTPVGLLERLPAYTHRNTAVRRLARDCLTTHPDLAVETTIRAGHPSDVLATLADETDAELVVLGAAEHGPVASATSTSR
jgi:nucleotide-binding universal stress UspA family protein